MVLSRDRLALGGRTGEPAGEAAATTLASTWPPHRTVIVPGGLPAVLAAARKPTGAFPRVRRGWTVRTSSRPLLPPIRGPRSTSRVARRRRDARRREPGSPRPARPRGGRSGPAQRGTPRPAGGASA